MPDRRLVEVNVKKTLSIDPKEYAENLGSGEDDAAVGELIHDCISLLPDYVRSTALSGMRSLMQSETSRSRLAKSRSSHD